MPESWIVGVDESGKGDFFGPLVVAAVAADAAGRARLVAEGVRDGKTLSLSRLAALDELIRESFPVVYVVLMPEEYNRRHREVGNLNKLLARGHARAIQGMLERQPARRAVSDKFGKAELILNELAALKVKVALEQLTHGEAVPEVAAASIAARARFVREMHQLEQEIGMELPRGAAPQVDQAGRDLVRRFGIETLSRVAKLHFKNYLRVVGRAKV